MKKVLFLGLGYIGLPTAAVAATHGYQVIGVDVNPSGSGHYQSRENTYCRAGFG